MTVPMGRLKGQNFAVDEYDESRGYCKLRETDSFELSDCLTAKVELEEPINQILNLGDERAISIHVYSKPFNRCISYCRDTDTFKEVNLYYTSINGKLCDGGDARQFGWGRLNPNFRSAAGDSKADYGGAGRFLDGGVAELATARVFGVAMIAPEQAAPCCEP